MQQYHQIGVIHYPKIYRFKWILHVYLLELYKNIDCFCWSYNLISPLSFQNHNLYLCDNICVTLSQGHPSMGVCSFGPFPGEELWNYHLTLGCTYGSTFALCRTQFYPGKSLLQSLSRHGVQRRDILTWEVASLSHGWGERYLDTGAGYSGGGGVGLVQQTNLCKAGLRY